MPLHPRMSLTGILLALSLALPACAASAPSGPADASPAQTAPALVSPQDSRADFDDLYARLQDSHYDLFARRPKREYDALFQQMRTGFDTSVAPLEVWKRYQRFVAYGNVAHAHMDPMPEYWENFRKAGGKAFPLFLRVVDAKAYVADDYSGLGTIAQGDEVVSIDGMPALRWLEQARAFVSADNDYMAWAQLESQLPMFVWLARGEVQSFALVLGKADGTRAGVTLPALSRADFEAVAAKRPKRFELDWNAREARILEGGLAYLRPGPFYDSRPDAADPWDTADFESFIDEAFGRFIAQGADRLLIDLRDNPGGDNSFSDLMVAWFAAKPFRFSEEFDIKISTAAIESNRKRLQGKGGETNSTSLRLAAAYDGKPLGSRVGFAIPLIAPRDGARFAGPVYLLVNRHSYSNTVLVAAIAQDYGFGKVLGEETSDLASTYGALEKFTLPRTGIEVSFPKARILRSNGDARARGVIPDIAIATPLVDDGTDRVLQQAIKIIDGKQRARSVQE